VMCALLCASPKLSNPHISLYHLKNRGLKAPALAGGHDGGSLA